jgi:RecG-like helicase
VDQCHRFGGVGRKNITKKVKKVAISIIYSAT